MDIALILLIVVLAAGLVWLFLARDSAVRAQHAAERELAVAREKLSEAENRHGDFETLRQEHLQATQAALHKTALDLSSKLLEDHKRENAESKKDAEARVKQASELLTKQVEGIAKALSELTGQVQDKGKTLDTVMRALSSPGGAGQASELGLANTLKSFGLEQGRDFMLQFTAESEDGRRLRPDAVVFLPGDGALVIDSKASKFLLDIAAAEGTAKEEEAYRGLASTMNQHLKALAAKDYQGAVQAAWRDAGRGAEPGRTLLLMYLPNEAALEKLNWFLRDFGYDAELLGQDEVDDKNLVGLRGVVKISHIVVNGSTLLNLDGFAPASQWEKLSDALPASATHPEVMP